MRRATPSRSRSSSRPRRRSNNSLVRYDTGTQIYAAWQVAAGNVEVHHNASNNGSGAGAQGDQHLDLNGGDEGEIAQRIEGLTPGVAYTLSFRYARHQGASRNTAQASIAGLDETFSTDVAGTTAWQTASYMFTANRASHTLRFESLDDDTWAGMLLDDVQIRRR